MTGKILQLRHIAGGGYKAISGLEFKHSKSWGNSFVKINAKDTDHCAYIDSYKAGNGEIEVQPLGAISKDTVEEYLMVIVNFSTNGIICTGEKLAGRNPCEGVFIMKPGDTIQVFKNDKSRTYMAVQAGNELLLVKKHR